MSEQKERRRLRHEYSSTSVIRQDRFPAPGEGREGEIAFRETKGVLKQLVKRSGQWKDVSGIGVETVGIGGNVSTSAGGSGSTASAVGDVLLADGSVVLAGEWSMGEQPLTDVNIDSGTIDGITTLGVANSVDIGNYTLTANGLTIDGTFTDGAASITSGAISGATTIGSSGAATLDSGGTGSSFGGALTVTTDITITGGDIVYGNTQNATNTITATAHNVAGRALTISAGDTTSGTTNNIAGGTLRFQGGQGKGTGAGGDITFHTANAGSSGSSINSLATALTISDDLSSTFADNVFLGSDNAVLNMGDGNDFTITHDGTTGATLAGNPITITSGGAAIWSTSAGNLTIDSAAAVLVLDGHTGITLDASNSGNVEINVTASDDILIGNDAVAQDILLGNAAASEVDLTAILVDINGGGSGVTIDGGAASNFTTSAGAITIDAAASTVTVDGHTGATVTSSNSGVVEITSAANVDINATTGVTIDGTTVSIDGTDDVNLTVTSSTGGEDLTIAQIGGNDSSIIITAAGTGADAVSIDVTAGDMLIAPSLIDGKTLTIGNTSSTVMQFLPNNTAASEKILVYNAVGTANDAIELFADSGGVTIRADNDSLVLDANGTDSDALNIDSAGGVDIDGTTGVTIDTSGGDIELRAAAADGDLLINSPYTELAAGNFDVMIGFNDPEAVNQEGRVFGTGHADEKVNYIWVGMWDLAPSAEYDTNFGGWS